MTNIDFHREKMGYARVGDTFLSKGGFPYKITEISCEKGQVHWRIMFSDGSIKRVGKQNGKLGNVKPDSLSVGYKGSYLGYIFNGYSFCVGNDKYYNVVKSDGTKCILRPIDIDYDMGVC